MINHEMRIWAYFSHPHRTVRIGAIRRFNGMAFDAKPVEWQERNSEAYGVEPPALFSIQPEEAQALADALWDAGIRPVQGNGSVGQLAATERHLSEMSRITEKLLVKVLA